MESRKHGPLSDFPLFIVSHFLVCWYGNESLSWNLGFWIWGVKWAVSTSNRVIAWVPDPETILYLGLLWGLNLHQDWSETEKVRDSFPREWFLAHGWITVWQDGNQLATICPTAPHKLKIEPSKSSGAILKMEFRGLLLATTSELTQSCHHCKWYHIFPPSNTFFSFSH